MNSVNGGREVDERWNKKEKKERDKDVRGQNLGPTLKTQPKAELTQSTQKKKKKKIIFKVFKYLSNSNFSIQNSHSQIFNSTFSMHKF